MLISFHLSHLKNKRKRKAGESGSEPLGFPPQHIWISISFLPFLVLAAFFLFSSLFFFPPKSPPTFKISFSLILIIFFNRLFSTLRSFVFSSQASFSPFPFPLFVSAVTSLESVSRVYIFLASLLQQSVEIHF